MANGVIGQLGLRVLGPVMEEHSRDTEPVKGHYLVGRSAKVIGHSNGSVTFIPVKVNFLLIYLSLNWKQNSGYEMYYKGVCW